MAGALDLEILAALREVSAGQAAVTAALTAQTGQLAALTVETSKLGELTRARQTIADQEATQERTTGELRWDRWAAFGGAAVALLEKACASWYGKAALAVLLLAMACRVLGMNVEQVISLYDRWRGGTVTVEEAPSVPAP